MEHCIAAYNERQEWESWKLYMTDGVAALINMFADKAEFPRCWELTHVEKKKERTGDEIALDVLLRSGLKARGRKQGR